MYGLGGCNFNLECIWVVEFQLIVKVDRDSGTCLLF